MKKLSFPLVAVAAVALAGLAGLTACSGGSSSDSGDASQDPATAVLGVWGEPDADGEPSIEFTDDGKYAGTDGCNRLFGAWTVDGDAIDLGAMGSTMMYCEGVDTWLTQGTTAVVQGDALVVSDEDGKEIGTLDRKE
ncbi:MAG: META domain-containing protein [Candidatus Leucobacter sulfamidivorax]|nr:META domain-containing protein [Candidatus Leucobacter sulfamidivorax]